MYSSNISLTKRKFNLSSDRISRERSYIILQSNLKKIDNKNTLKDNTISDKEDSKKYIIYKNCLYTANSKPFFPPMNRYGRKNSIISGANGAPPLMQNRRLLPNADFILLPSMPQSTFLRILSRPDNGL